jgi:hypothetical protein
MSEAEEQKARIALLQHYASQMQGYKIYILTLALSSVGFIELWIRIVDWLKPSTFFVGIVLSFFIGGFGAALFYCLARAAWYGALSSNCLLPLPYTVEEAPCRPLLYRLGQKICDRVRDNPLEGTPEFTPAWAWKWLIRIGSTSKQPSLAHLCLFLWWFLWAAFFLTISALVKG